MGRADPEVPETEPGTMMELETAETGLGLELGPGTEPETELELESVGTVLKPLPELVSGQGTELETMLEPEMEPETEQSNKYCGFHP